MSRKTRRILGWAMLCVWAFDAFGFFGLALPLGLYLLVTAAWSEVLRVAERRDRGLHGFAAGNAWRGGDGP